MNYKEKLKQIKAFAFDVDGVFTNGMVYVDAQGNLNRAFNAKDGFAIQLAMKKGFHVAIITGGRDESVRIRFNKLGITDVFMNIMDKNKSLDEYCAQYHFKPEEILYMGDDLPDLPVLRRVGLACCPNDAVQEVREASQYISDRKGGEGCVRDAIEQTLKVQNLWVDQFDTIIPSR